MKKHCADVPAKVRSCVCLNQLPILDTGREAQNILRTKALLQDACLSDYFESWYRYTMQVSKEYQKEIKEKHNQK